MLKTRDLLRAWRNNSIFSTRGNFLRGAVSYLPRKFSRSILSIKEPVDARRIVGKVAFYFDDDPKGP